MATIVEGENPKRREKINGISAPLVVSFMLWHAYLSCTPSTPACQSTLGQMAYLRSSASQTIQQALPAAGEEEKEREDK